MKTRLVVCVLRTFGILQCATLKVSNTVLLHVKDLNFAELSVNISRSTEGGSYFDSFAISATWWLNPTVHSG